MDYTISFQYLEPGDQQPRSGYQITDSAFDVPPSATAPRVGEFVQLILLNSTETYEVLAVTTRIVALEGQKPGWHSYVTVGPVQGSTKQKLSIVRE